jgi:hypothetical protein
MAFQKRYNGDSQGLVNVDRSRADAPAAKIISQGIGKHITAFKINGGADLSVEMGVGGAVETILRTVQMKATTIAYQVDGAQLSLIVEATGWGYQNIASPVTADADLQAALVALGNRAADANFPVTAFDFTALVVSSTGGIQLA